MTGTYAIIANPRQQGTAVNNNMLQALTGPGGQRLFPSSAQPITFQTLFSLYSKVEPVAGSYLAVLEQGSKELSCRAPLDPESLLPVVDNARVRRLLGKDVNRLIVEWDPLSGAQAYAVEVGREGEVLAKQTIAGDSQRASWDGLPLERGQEYLVVIRAFAFPFYTAPDEPLDPSSFPDQTNVSERGFFFEAQ